jgi:ferric-dicitrate binding protein FerR (iron transport regulator)
MDRNEIKAWSRKYLGGELREKERAMFEAWYLETGEDIAAPPDEMTERLRAEIFQKLPGNKSGKFSGGFLVAAAAVAVLTVSLILQVVFHKSDLIVANRVHDIPPGGNRAVLTLANGQQIDLATAANGRLAAQGNSRIMKNASGEIFYQEDGHQKEERSPGQNEISTPDGGTWQIRLPDGTKVWINNSSFLRYPTTFGGQEQRTVNLTGEAYFEVAKDKQHPFVVKSIGQEIRVLGTHFNIRAFRNDQVAVTTLIEGRVAISSSGERFARAMIAGEQAQNKNGHLTIGSVDTAEAIAWKNGYFRFNNTPVDQVMRELSRWYGVEVRYEGPIPDENLNGRISRSKNISKVLTALEATKIVHFEIEGRRVTVRK